MRYWMDCEFIEDGRTIDLISIGIVADDGRELYMQSVEFDATKASPWVSEHVFPHLAVCPHVQTGRIGVNLWLGDHRLGQCTFETSSTGITGLRGIQFSGGYLIGTHADCPWRTREQIRREVLHFMDVEKYGIPELWGYYSAYDHVVFCQLFGTMMDLPKGFPMIAYDLRQWLDMNGMSDVHQPDNSVHNSLEDAQWIAKTYKRLVR